MSDAARAKDVQEIRDRLDRGYDTNAASAALDVRRLLRFHNEAAGQTAALRAALKLEHENTLHGSPSTHSRIGDAPGCEVCALLADAGPHAESQPKDRS